MLVIFINRDIPMLKLFAQLTWVRQMDLLRAGIDRFILEL
jgi:hypothetical protein